MELLEQIKRRRSIRFFKDDSIPDEVIRELEESLIWAPSAGNLQSRKFYFIYQDPVKVRLAKAAYGQDFICEVPLVVVGCADLRIAMHYGERGTSLYSLQDVAASVQNMMLLAASRGFGTVWVGAFKEVEVSEILGLPRHLRPVAIVPVGTPGESPHPPERVSREEAIVHLR